MLQLYPFSLVVPRQLLIHSYTVRVKKLNLVRAANEADPVSSSFVLGEVEHHCTTIRVKDFVYVLDLFEIRIGKDVRVWFKDFVDIVIPQWICLRLLECSHSVVLLLDYF